MANQDSTPAADANDVPKRKRGRPKGAKNKPKHPKVKERLASLGGVIDGSNSNQPVRQSDGTFAPGSSGNPGGRVKKRNMTEFRNLCADMLITDGYDALLEKLTDGGEKLSVKELVQVVTFLRDTAWGRPAAVDYNTGESDSKPVVNNQIVISSELLEMARQNDLKAGIIDPDDED